MSSTPCSSVKDLELVSYPVLMVLRSAATRTYHSFMAMNILIIPIILESVGTWIFSSAISAIILSSVATGLISVLF